MSDRSDYGYAFREAYSLLHGGRSDEGPEADARHPGEPLEEYLARSRAEVVGRVQRRLEAAEPPPGLRTAHDLLVRLLAAAAEADAALAAQVNAYSCGNFGETISHSDRLHTIVSESARLDRELIVALRQAEDVTPGTLSALGIAEVPERPIAAEDAEDWV